MQRFKASPSVFSLLVIAVLVLIFFLITNKSRTQYGLPVYYKANEAYNEGNYQQALDGFYASLKTDKGILKQDPLLYFKIGYALLRTNEWNKAIQVFEKNRSHLKEVEDYLVYFQLDAHLKMGDTLSTMQQIHYLRNNFPSSPLIFFADSMQASLFLQNNEPDSALKYLNLMLKSGQFERTRIYLEMLDIFGKKEDISTYRENAFKFLARYPFHNQAEAVYEGLLQTYPDKIPLGDLRKVFNYLFTTKQFLAAEKLVGEQMKLAQSINEKDYLYWVPVEVAYRQEEYQRVLDWCLGQRKNFQTQATRRLVDLHIARCYLRLGDVKKSIHAYLQYQHNYPSDGLSPEVLWKVAWLYENNQEISRAIKMYQKLVKTYRRSQFNDESYFRIGLNYYRMGKYRTARDNWQRALPRINDSSQRDRIRYWIGKCYEKEGEYEKKGEIYIDLARRPADSFYNLKAFYLTSDSGSVHQNFRETLWQLHHLNHSFLPRNILRFRKALLVKEMLGSRWSDLELQTLNFDINDWQKIYALGELYERMENYGQAYRTFRSIFNTHFSSADITEMLPVFKKLYPFYFKNFIDSTAEKFSVPQELILSVMKKESAFEPEIISYANAYGLMQLLPMTASQIAPGLRMRYTSTRQLFDPETNIKMGTYYLSSLLKRYDGDIIKALAAYNAGPHRVDRWVRDNPTDDDDLFMENIEFEQTRVYVRTCLKYYWIYRAISDPGQVPEEVLRFPVSLTRVSQ